MEDTRPTKYWIVVVSRDHLEIGKSLGIVQANHGKAAPLKRMRPGDMILFYSPKTAYEGGVPWKKFTAIARVKDGDVYEGQMGDFHAFRRDVEYLPCEETDILPLIPEMSFIRNKKSWGFIFRFGCFEVPKEDFERVTAAMEASSE